MTLAFKYWHDPSGIVKPIIPVVFINEKDNSDLIGMGTLVDSGADFTTISETFAKRLNLKLSKKISFTQGVGGNTKLKETNGNLILLRGAEAYKLRVPINVILKNENELPYPLLGREGIFNHFDITFRERKSTLDFVKKDDTLKKIPIPKKLRKK